MKMIPFFIVLEKVRYVNYEWKNHVRQISTRPRSQMLILSSNFNHFLADESISLIAARILSFKAATDSIGSV